MSFMFDRSLPRLVALAVGVLVILKLVFPEPPREKEEKEEEDDSNADTGGTDKEPEPAATHTEEEDQTKEEPEASAAAQTGGADSAAAEDLATRDVAEGSTPEESEREEPQPEEPAEPAPQAVEPEAPPEPRPNDTAQAPPPAATATPPIEHHAPATDETKESERPTVESELIPPELTGQDKDLVDAAAASGSFSALGMALEQTRLDATLRSQGPFTVFAPTDKAFAELEALDELMDDTERLAWVLKNHIVSGHYIAADLPAVASLDAISGASLSIDTSDDIKVEDASVVEPDIIANNGVIHAINKVIIRRRFTR
jgi:uncharacterized surface protein with fasciclin (FAS1) repeats